MPDAPVFQQPLRVTYIDLGRAAPLVDSEGMCCRFTDISAAGLRPADRRDCRPDVGITFDVDGSAVLTDNTDCREPESRAFPARGSFAVLNGSRDV